MSSMRMTEHLKLDFQITLDDWLEFRRSEQSVFRLWCLRLADVLWVPTWVLLAVSILIAAATLSKLVSISIPTWLPIPMLTLFAASHVFRSLPINTATRKAKKEWLRILAHVDCTVELTENGFQYIAGSSTYKPVWAEVGSVFQSEHLLIFCDHDEEYVLLIPKRSFASEKQLHEFLDIASQETVVERDGEVAT